MVALNIVEINMSHLTTLIERFDALPEREKGRAIMNMVEFLGVPNTEKVSSRELASASMRIFEYANTRTRENET